MLKIYAICVIFVKEGKATFAVALTNPAQEVSIAVSVPLFPEEVPVEIEVTIPSEVWPEPPPTLPVAAEAPPLSSQQESLVVSARQKRVIYFGIYPFAPAT